MKKLILIASCAVLFLTSRIIWAEEIRVDEKSKTVYYVPTPTLHVVEYDLEEEGAVFNIYLDYKTEVVHAQYEALVAAYPGKTLKRISANPNGAVIIKIPALNLETEAVVKMSQMGVIWNSEFNLSQAQYRKFVEELKGKPLSALVSVDAPATIEYNYSNVLEEYVAADGYCSSMSLYSSVGDIVLGLNQMRKPRDMRYESTFADFKNSILYKCFDLKAQNKIASSIQELLESVVQVRTAPQKISAYTIRVEARQEQIQVPYLIERR